ATADRGSSLFICLAEDAVEQTFGLLRYGSDRKENAFASRLPLFMMNIESMPNRCVTARRAGAAQRIPPAHVPEAAPALLKQTEWPASKRRTHRHGRSGLSPLSAETESGRSLASGTDQSAVRLAYAATSHFGPASAKFTWMQVCAPEPSALTTTPSPKLAWRTRWPSLTGSVSSRSAWPREARVVYTGREIFARGRTSVSRCAGSSSRNRDGRDRVSLPYCRRDSA